MQETAALTVVDTFIRERLCTICQHEEDIEAILGGFRKDFSSAILNS
jgi:hypothetical protein